jgi:uncharacterized protein YrrD
VTVRLGRILGLPAVCGGRVVGHVERAVPDENGQQVTGFIVRRGLGSAKWADRSTVTVLGDVSVILGQKPGRVPKGSDLTIAAVKDESGLALGRVTDWWISRDSLHITALEITLGPVEDMLSGRRKVTQWAVQPGEDGATVLIPREEWENRREEKQ